MNERQKKLYEFLLDNSGKRYISKEEICRSLYELYPRHVEHSTEHNSRTFTLIRKDVQEINEEAEKIIVSNKVGYKIGNLEETKDFINRRFIRDLSSLKRDWKLRRKVADNHQMTIDMEEIRTFLEG